MSVSEAKAKVTVTEFIRWHHHWELQWNEPTREHWYYAQIASEIARIPFLVWGKDPPKEIKDIKSFLLKFGSAEDTAERQKLSQEERELSEAQYRKEVSTSVWLSALGFNEKLEYIGKIPNNPDTTRPFGPDNPPPVPSGNPAPDPVQSPQAPQKRARTPKKRGLGPKDLARD